MFRFYSNPRPASGRVCQSTLRACCCQQRTYAQTKLVVKKSPAKKRAVENPIASSRAKPENPLARQLFERAGAGNTRKSKKFKADKSRINIVSEQLCDDVLERLKPSLERHKGCDIIDVNPGAGLWSKKLHNAIKPRTHILLEPDFDLYLPFLQPLLDAPDSKFKLIPKSGILWSTLEGLKTDGYIPHQEAYPLGDPRLEKNNDTLLFVANLGYWPGKAYLGFSSVALLMIHQLATAVRNHRAIHRYGHVRMLIWISDGEKGVVIPRSVAFRRKFTVETETTFKSVVEVAGVDDTASRGFRDRQLDLESTQRVLAKMKAAGIFTPPNRMGKDEKDVLALHNENAVNAPADSEGILRKHTNELRELEEGWASGKFAKSDSQDARKRTPEYARLVSLRHRHRMYLMKANRAENVILKYEALLMDESRLSLDAEDYAEQKEIIENRWEEMEDILDALPNNDEKGVYHQLDERRVFYNDPPVLKWDQREYEPLKVHANEFYPLQEMALIDFQPQPAWPIIAQDPSTYDIFEFIVMNLAVTSSQNLVRGLNSLAPGSVEWIIPRCPSLTDVKRGGQTDVKKLRVRTLTQEHWRDIFEVWMDWPFKPTKGEMMAKMGSQYLGDDADNESLMGGAMGI